MKILVIDDNKDYVTETCGFLCEQGYEAIGAESVALALNELRAVGREIAIALIDMHIGDDDVAGLKLIRRLRSDYPTIVPIAVTAYASTGNAAACMEAGAFNYVFKDITPPVLLLHTVRLGEKHWRACDSLARLPDSFRQLELQFDSMRSDIGRILESMNRIRDEVHLLADMGAVKHSAS